MNPADQHSNQRLLADDAAIREAIRLLRETVIEDRKQIMLRVVFVLALVAFTVKDVLGAAARPPIYVGWTMAAALLCLIISTLLYFHHFHKSIDVLGQLSRSLAYSNLGEKELDIPIIYWEARRRRWSVASALFYSGCTAYCVALMIILLVPPHVA